jgi:Ser/Thr protein kinase RdoA (MazF antagonist)
MEETLRGGRLTSGVVRVGETVRRPVTPASAFVARLLAHLADHGYAACPRHHGQDASGRDVLSFVAGEVVGRWRRFPDSDVAAVAAMLRGFHEASRGLAHDVIGFSRDLYSGYTGADAVVCHHDPGPNNVLLDRGVPVAFIDFDFAAPGHRLEDLGYLAWSWCISSRPDRGPAPEQARQVRVLADAYGLDDPDRFRLLPAVRARMKRNLVFWHRLLGQPWDRNGASPEDVIAWTRRELAFTALHRDAFVGRLRAVRAPTAAS